MKLIRLIGSTSATDRQLFSCTFKDNVNIPLDAELALVNCTIPISQLSNIIVDEDNNEFYLGINGGTLLLVALEQGTYGAVDLLNQLQAALYLYGSLDGATKCRGLEWSATLTDNRKLKLQFDRVDDYLVTDAIPHLNRNPGQNGGPRLVFDPNGAKWTRDLAEGGTDSGGWAFSGVPWNLSVNARMQSNIGTTRKATNVYVPWYMGVVPSDGRPDRNNDFSYMTDMRYGVYLEDDQAFIRHEGTSYPVVLTPGILPQKANIEIERWFDGENPLIGMVYRFTDENGANLVVQSGAWDADAAGLLYGLQNGTDLNYPTPTLYPIWGVGDDVEGELLNLYYTPSTSALPEEGFVRLPTDIELQLLTPPVKDLLGIQATDTKASNFGAPGLISGSSAVGAGLLLESLVLYMNNLDLDCYDGGQGSQADKGKRQSIIAVIPGAYKENYSISYEPCNLIWIPIKNAIQKQMDTFQWGFAFGNEFKPYLSTNSTITLAIRSRSESD